MYLFFRIIVSLEMSMLQFTYDSEAERHVLVEFSNGKPAEGSILKCKIDEDKRPGFQHQKQLLVTGTHLHYSGNNYEMRRSHPYACKYVVAKVNKHTGETQVFDTDHFKLQPSVNKPSIDHEASVREQAVKTNFEKNRDLVGSFGSNRQKRKLMANQRTDGANAAAEVQNSVEEFMKVNKLPAEDDVSELTSFMPYNRNADTVEEVYPLNNLVPAEVCESLVSEAEQFIQPSSETLAEWQQSSGPLSSKFILVHAKNPGVARIQDPDLYNDFACCLQLMFYIIKVYCMKSRGSAAKEMPFLNGDSPLATWLSSKYFSHGARNARAMSQKSKDQLLAIGIVLAWHIDSFVTNAPQLQAAFGVSKKKVSSVVKALGGSTKTTTKGNTKVENYVLSLPLKFSRSMISRKLLR